MSTSQIQIARFSDLLPRLKGKVFHVTLASTFDEIKNAGKITVDPGGRVSPFGTTENGYFRFKGCISFFDYRSYGSPEWEEHAYKCLPTMPLDSSSAIVVLFLSDKEHHHLRPWEEWKREELWTYRVVPYIECGYPSPVLLEAIDEVLLVRRGQA